MRAGLIAPCGVNCRLCAAYQSARNPCAGCNAPDAEKPKHCRACVRRDCPKRAALPGGACTACAEYPCRRLRELDRRYRTRYGVGLLRNLETIRELGMDAFLTRETARWTCPACGAVLCMHEPLCPGCGAVRKQEED